MNWFRKTFGRQPAAQPQAQPSAADSDSRLFGPADALAEQAGNFMQQGQPDRALPAMDAAIASTIETLGGRKDLPARESRLAELYGLQGSIKVKLGDLDGAASSLLDCWATCRALSDRHPDHAEMKADVSIALQKVARVLMLQGRPADALKFIQDASAIMASVAQANPHVTKYRQYFEAYTGLLAECFTALGKPELAAELLKRPRE